MILFFLIFFTTNIIFSSIICSFLMRLSLNDGIETNQLFLHSLGTGPIFTTLIIYYLFLFVPNQSSLFYILLVILFYLILAVLGKTYFKPLLHSLYGGQKILFAGKGDFFNKIWPIGFCLFILLPMTVYIFVYIFKILPQPLIGHDIAHYAVVGDIFYIVKSLAPAWGTSVAEYGYAHGSSNAPFFSLLLTWERMLNSLFNVNSDFYFKSISAYYGLLIAGVQLHLVLKKNKWLAILSVFALFTGLSYYLNFFTREIDTFRIFFWCNVPDLFGVCSKTFRHA